MKIKVVEARWLRVPLHGAQQHVSDFGRQSTFDMAIVRIETDSGLVGWGEAKSAVGSSANCAAVVACINHEFAPVLRARDPREITRLWETMYSGPRADCLLSNSVIASTRQDPKTGAGHSSRMAARSPPASFTRASVMCG